MISLGSSLELRPETNVLLSPLTPQKSKLREFEFPLTSKTSHRNSIAVHQQKPALCQPPPQNFKLSWLTVATREILGKADVSLSVSRSWVTFESLLPRGLQG